MKKPTKQSIINAVSHVILFLLFYGHYQKKYLRGPDFCHFWSNGWAMALHDYLSCKRLHVNKDVPWPVSPFSRVISPENIVFSSSDIHNFQSFGQYYQALGKISIGEGTFIGPNVGLISSNHDFDDLTKHSSLESIQIGKKSWIGMNSIILPGVCLGDQTIVGAGSVVTKSFPDGHVVIAGNPAKIIKQIGE